MSKRRIGIIRKTDAHMMSHKYTLLMSHVTINDLTTPKFYEGRGVGERHATYLIFDLSYNTKDYLKLLMAAQ